MPFKFGVGRERRLDLLWFKVYDLDAAVLFGVHMIDGDTITIRQKSDLEVIRDGWQRNGPNDLGFVRRNIPNGK